MSVAQRQGVPAQLPGIQRRGHYNNVTSDPPIRIRAAQNRQDRSCTGRRPNGLATPMASHKTHSMNGCSQSISSYPGIRVRLLVLGMSTAGAPPLFGRRYVRSTKLVPSAWGSTAIRRKLRRYFQSASSNSAM